MHENKMNLFAWVVYVIKYRLGLFIQYYMGYVRAGVCLVHLRTVLSRGAFILSKELFIQYNI